MKRYGLLLISVMVAASLLGAATFFFYGADAQAKPSSASSQSCLFRFSGFKNSKSWYAAGNSITVEADSACGSSRGHSYDLVGVTVAITRHGKVLARVRSAEGAYSVFENKVVIWNGHCVSGSNCLKNTETLTLDLKSGEVIAPGTRVFLSRGSAS